MEELPAQPVLASRRSRPGLTGAIAVGVLVLILAGGLGVWGGRPTPSPTSHVVAAVSPSPSSGPGFDVGPRVTPVAPCRPLTDAVPQLQLETEDQSFAGLVLVLHRDEPAAAPTPAIAPPAIPSDTATITVRSDVLTLIRTIGEVCATSWTFDLLSPEESIGVESFMSTAADPERARQNQFALDLARYRGRDYALRGMLTFPGLVAQTTWPIRILPFDVPRAELTMSGQRLDVEPGCDLQLTLGTGYTELANPCYTGVQRLPEATSIAAPESFLSLRFPAGWFLLGANVACGSLAEGYFQPDEGCEIRWTDEGTSLTIFVPGLEGTWSLAINGCATQLLSDTTNKVCGTWYATVEVNLS